MAKIENNHLQRIIIGSLLLDNPCGKIVFNSLNENFFSNEMRQIFILLKKNYTEKNGVMEFAFLPQHLIPIAAETMADVVSTSHIRLHIEEMKDIFFKNSILEKTENFSEKIKAQNRQEVKGEVISLLENFPKNREEKTHKEKMQSFFSEYCDALDRGFSGIKTLNVLDKIIGGVSSGQLCVIGARPGIGKTAFALQMAVEMAKNNTRVVFFSMEMGQNEIVSRIIANTQKLPNLLVQQKKIGGDGLEKIAKGAEMISMLPLEIMQSYSLKCSDIEIYFDEMEAKGERPDVIFVDYLQLMDNEIVIEKGKVQTLSTTERLAAVSRGLKKLAEKLQTPIIALAQLNRENQKKQEKRPELHELKGSGSIEQDANVVIGLWESGDEEGAKIPISVSVIKNRNGPIGDGYCIFNRTFQSFTEIL